MRIPDDVDLRLTINREKIQRNIGDIIGLKLSGEYYFFNGLSAFLLYYFDAKMKDKVKGNMGYRYRSVEDETNYRSHLYGIGLTYSTIPMFMAKKSPVRLSFSASYRHRFAGKNNVLDLQYIRLDLQVFFQ